MGREPRSVEWFFHGWTSAEIAHARKSRRKAYRERHYATGRSLKAIKERAQTAYEALKECPHTSELSRKRG